MGPLGVLPRKNLGPYTTAFPHLSGCFHEHRSVIADGNDGQKYVNETKVCHKSEFYSNHVDLDPCVALTGPRCFP